jgi:hypothetical protein
MPVKHETLRRSRQPIQPRHPYSLIMPQSIGRQLLEQLIGKTVVEVSHTDSDEIAAKTDMSLYVFFTDGTVLKAGPNTFQVFRPGQYQG